MKTKTGARLHLEPQQVCRHLQPCNLLASSLLSRSVEDPAAAEGPTWAWTSHKHAFRFRSLDFQQLLTSCVRRPECFPAGISAGTSAASISNHSWLRRERGLF